MLDLRTRASLLGRTEAEIREEMACALGRVARRLEDLLDRLHGLAADLAPLAGEERAETLRRHESLRAEAQRQLWYLIVQREAIGLRDHAELRFLYPIPPRLR